MPSIIGRDLVSEASTGRAASAAAIPVSVGVAALILLGHSLVGVSDATNLAVAHIAAASAWEGGGAWLLLLAGSSVPPYCRPKATPTLMCPNPLPKSGWEKTLGTHRKSEEEPASEDPDPKL
ncbi:hypothetical protein HaLaN_09497 [Haematococcus lacustris]|uniref:Uncharacterized protein n=1 Tax=Haematococcus lacustris TaxID=44745 RepID=A0A699Z3H4_HAELA|nr:hypothetical protein HaLaN_09497 [Haematococcus lacustris]